MKTPLIMTCAVFSLAACAVDPAYGPALKADDFGYREQRIETDRYRIIYRDTDFSSASDGALRRAAEVTVQQGYDYFVVVSRDTGVDRTGGYGPTVGVGGSTGSRNSGVGVGISLPIGGGSREEITSRLEIQMGRGPKPENAPESYNARAVLQNLVQ